MQQSSEMDEFDAATEAHAAAKASEEKSINGATGKTVSANFAPLDMSLLQAGQHPAPVLPLELFGDQWAKWNRDSAEGSGAPVDYIAFSLLSAVSAVVGSKKAAAAWPSWVEPAAVWVGNIGRPSAGKTPAMKCVAGLLNTLEKDLAAKHPDALAIYERDKQRAKAVREKWTEEVKAAVKKEQHAPDMPAAAIEPEKPRRPRLMLNDATTEEIGAIMASNVHRLVSWRDEMAGWLGGMGRYSGADGADRAFWLESYNGGRFAIDRVKNQGEPVIIEHLLIAVCGGLQPDRLNDLLSGAEDGLASRLLLIWPEAIPPRTPRFAADGALAIKSFRHLLNLTAGTDENGGQFPMPLFLCGEAKAKFAEWRTLHAESEMEVSGALLNHYGKLPGIVLRLSLLFELLWWSTGEGEPEPAEISTKALLAALALVDLYLKPMAIRAYGDAGLPVAERNAAALGRWLLKAKPETVNARSLRRNVKLPGMRTSGAVAAALEVAVEAGWLKPCFTREGDSKGRQREDFAVNPGVYHALVA